MRANVVVAILTSVSLTACAQVLLKMGASAPELQKALEQGAYFAALWRGLTSLPVVLGLTCFGAGLVAWMFVLSQTNVSTAYPFVSLGIVLTAVGGYFFLGEDVSWLRVAGIGAVVAGVVAIGLSA